MATEIETTPVKGFREVIDIIEKDDIGEFLNVHLNLLNLVPQRGADSLLMIAAEYTALDSLEYLLDANVDVNYQNQNGITALMLAVRKNHPLSPEIIRRMLLKGANPNLLLLNDRSRTVLDMAFRDGVSFEIISLLIEFGGTTSGESPLIWNLLTNYHKRGPLDLIMMRADMVEEQDREVVSKVASVIYDRDGVNWELGYLSDQGEGIIHGLAKYDLGEILQRLLNDRKDEIMEKGYLNCRDVTGRTPLMVALHQKNIQSARILIENGADLNEKIGRTGILEFAIECGISDEILEILEQYGAEIPQENMLLWYFQSLRENKIPLDINTHRVIDRLLKYEIEKQTTVANSMLDCGCCLQMGAAFYGFQAVFDHLMEHSDSKMVLDLICEKHGSIIRQAVSPDSRFKSGETALYLVKKLLEAGAQLTEDLLTITSDPEMAQLLLDHDVGVNLPFEMYHPMIWQVICLHPKHRERLLNRNEEEMTSFDDPDEIVPDHFIRMENGIFWDIHNLFGYITEIRKGINQYDNSTPFDGESIWSEGDLRMLQHHSKVTGIELGRQICKFVDVNDLLKKIPLPVLRQFEICSSILQRKGNLFEEQINNELTPAELEIWSKRYVIGTRIPDVMTKKIDGIRLQCLGDFFAIYQPLPTEVKKTIAQIHSGMTEQYFNDLANGNECLRGASQIFEDVWNRVRDWVQTQTDVSEIEID